MSTGTVTLGGRLARHRLENRAARLEGVVAALRSRARDYRPGTTPPGLVRALREFEHELTDVRARLRSQADPVH